MRLGRDSYTRAELEPLSFDDLPLGGEWKTRRRTISESDIALYTGLAGDFSPLAIEAGQGPRPAPPALILAMAIGLGSMDMPVPSVAEWEWLNWRFPRPVHAGDTIFARWTLTQKRPPAHQAQSSIVVWRVDVVKTDGTLCAEGEVGAKVKRQMHPADRGAVRESDAAASAATPGRSRRRRRRANGHSADTAVAAAPTKTAQAPKAATQPAAGAPKPRRRRRRSSSPNAPRESESPAMATNSVPEPRPDLAAAPAPAVAAAKASESGGGGTGSTLGRVISRLRRV